MLDDSVSPQPHAEKMQLNDGHCTKSELKKLVYASAGEIEQWLEDTNTRKVSLISHVEALDADAVLPLSKLPCELRQQIYEDILFEPDAGHCYPQILQTSKWVYAEARDIMAKVNEVEIEICSTAWPSYYELPPWPGLWSLYPPYGAPPAIPPVFVTVPVHTQAGPPPPVYINSATYDEYNLTVYISIGGALLHDSDVTGMHVVNMWDMWPLWVRKAEKLAVTVNRMEGVPGLMYYGPSPHIFVEQLLLSLGAVANG
ncbi:hypothetical protein LTR95_013344, partial [Oleoguttula sp. CCFEE 5521]